MKNILNNTLIPLLLVCLSSFQVYGQDDSLEGSVVASDGLAIENVKITVLENPNVAAYTDVAGNFSIAAQAEDRLVIEFKNKARKVVPVSELDDDNQIVLDKASVQVNLGFNTRVRNEELASSVGNIGSESLQNITVLTPGNALFGQIPGLRVFQENGIFPEDRQPSMDIRGLSTTRNNTILVLIDGVERPLNTVILEEIESVSVLKDAAAKAVYGQRGANGVLLINTKRGVKGETKYNATVERGITTPTRLPEFLDAPGYAMALNEALTNDGLDPRYSQLEINRFSSGEYPTFYPNVNWVDQTFADAGQFTRVNFNVSGGKEIVDFWLGFNYQSDEGLYNYTDAFDDFSTQLDYDKLNFRTNLDVAINPSTKAMINLAGNLMTEKGPPNADVAGNAYNIPSAAFPVRNFNNSWGGSNQFPNNPVAELSATGYNMTQYINFLVDARITQDLTKIVDGLSAELFAAYDNQTNFFENSTKNYQYQEINPVLDESGAILDTLINVLGEDSDLNPSRSAGNLQSSHYDLRGKLNYSQNFGNSSIDSWIMYQQEMQQLRGTNNQYRYQNLAANMHYGLYGKYFFNASLSYYGSNLIQDEDDRFGFFPAIAAAWLISEESFFEDITAINSMKIRASIGKAGNGQIPIDHLTVPSYSGGGSYIFGDDYQSNGGRTESQLPIEQKTFESSVEANFGIEARLFDNLSFNAEYFMTERSNIFVPALGQYSEVIGLLPDIVPEGIVESSGYELDLTWSDRQGDFSYYLSGSFSQYQNEIIDINEEFRPYDYLKREGGSIGQFFGWETNGFYQDQNDIDNSPVSQLGEVLPGDVKYVDQNNDGVIDEFDQLPVGNPNNPDIYYSASLGIGYKGFNVSVLFQGTEGSSTYLNEANIYWPLRNNGNISTWYDNYWTINNRDNAELPRLTTESNNNYRVNNIWVRDNSFLKLRYAEVSYSLPADLISGLGLQQSKIYLRGRNLFTIDDIEYMDPENPEAHYPSLRSFNVGINLTF